MNAKYSTLFTDTLFTLRKSAVDSLMKSRRIFCSAALTGIDNEKEHSSSLSEDINCKGHAMNNRILYLPAIIILLTSPFAVLAQQNGAGSLAEVLTLDQAISLALRDNRQVKNAQLGVGKARGRLWPRHEHLGCRSLSSMRSPDSS